MENEVAVDPLSLRGSAQVGAVQATLFTRSLEFYLTLRLVAYDRCSYSTVSRDVRAGYIQK